MLVGYLDLGNSHILFMEGVHIVEDSTPWGSTHGSKASGRLLALRIGSYFLLITTETTITVLLDCENNRLIVGKHTMKTSIALVSQSKVHFHLLFWTIRCPLSRRIRIHTLEYESCNTELKTFVHDHLIIQSITLAASKFQFSNFSS